MRYKEWDVRVVKREYGNGKTALCLEGLDGEPIATGTVNLPDVDIGLWKGLEGEVVFVKGWSENEGMLEFLVKNKVVRSLGQGVETGFVMADVCELLI